MKEKTCEKKKQKKKVIFVKRDIHNQCSIVFAYERKDLWEKKQKKAVLY